MKIIALLFLWTTVLYIAASVVTGSIHEEKIQVTYVPKDKSNDNLSDADVILKKSSWTSEKELPSTSEIDKLMKADFKAVDTTIARFKETGKKQEADIREDREILKRDKKESENIDKEIGILHENRVIGKKEFDGLDSLDEAIHREMKHTLDSFFVPNIQDEFAGGEELFEQFFPGALQLRRRRHDGFLSSIMRGIENSVFNTHHERYGNGMRHGRNPTKKWNSADHKHKSQKQCCCQDIHKFCRHINTDGGAVGFYKVMKCLADRQRKHFDIHPLCVARLSKTVAGNCAADIDRVCSDVLPGNNALHKCLLKHQNDGATSGTCQAYLDLVQVETKVKRKHVRAASVERGKLSKLTKSSKDNNVSTPIVKKGDGVKTVAADTTAMKKVPEVMTKLVLKSPKAGINNKDVTKNVNSIAANAADASKKMPRHFIKPMYLVFGIAGVVLIIVGIVLGVKRQRDQMSRDANIHYASLQ